MPGLLPVSADVSMAPNTESQSLAITDLTQGPREPVPKKQKTTQDTEGCGESRGERGRRQCWKQWRGCTRAQQAEAQELLSARHRQSSHRNDAKTVSAKRPRHQSTARRRVRHLHRAKPVERSLRKSLNSGLQRSSATEGSRPWAGISVFFGLGWVGSKGSVRK